MSEQVPAWIPRMFRIATVVNFVVGAPGMLAPRRTAEMFGTKPPEPAFPLQAWSGMAFMFGFMFLEVAGDPVGKRALIRYGWAEKLVSAIATTVGYRRREAPLSTLIMVTATDWAPILPFLYAERRLNEIAARRQAEGPSTP